uniref:G domain-containing protein n=1 Tax=Erpetoichthys calabaricus TaxID=27687 RepID=A0A8C4SXM3_ERPCA
MSSVEWRVLCAQYSCTIKKSCTFTSCLECDFGMRIFQVFLWIVSFSFCFFSFVTSRVKNELLEDIRNYETLTESVEEPRILLIGQIGSGKSSFFNSVNSVFRGHVIQQAGSGHGETSMSKWYRTYPVHDGKGGKKLPFALCDTMGLEREENEEGIHKDDIISVIKGHVPDLYEFNPKEPITKNDTRYRHAPGLGDKVHCVVFVIDADKLSLIDNILQQKFQRIRSDVYEMVIIQDGAEITPTFRKITVGSPKQLGQILGVTVSAISLVKNYSSGTELDQNVDILILKALQQMLRATDACLDEMKLRGLTESSSS